MDIGILGTGIVGQTIGSRLVELGHNVKMGSRTPDNDRARAWSKISRTNASYGTFADAAEFGEVLFNCTTGMGALSALQQAGTVNLTGKVLVDVTNPLDFSRGGSPTLTVCNTDSLGEQIQRAHPLARVVKTLNTVNCPVMVHPEIVPGDHDMFICGNDADAKAMVTLILEDWFGWKSVIDLGNITASRGMEMMLPMWLTLRERLNTTNFNFKIVK